MRTFIPTPNVTYVSVGPLKIHFYALCILVGISLAIFIGRKRLSDDKDLISDIAIYAIPAGIIGARFYHVITTPEEYFNSHFLDALKIWQGGLGIWGAISFGAIASYLYLKKAGISSKFLKIADALAPGLLIAQAIGRLGNWFNGELFGRPSRMPWAVEIPEGNRPLKYINEMTFHPTFLYEAVWSLMIALFLMRLRTRKPGQIFWLYVAGYSIGRALVEVLRIDYSHILFGLRLNLWIAIFCTILGVWQYWKIAKQRVE